MRHLLAKAEISRLKRARDGGPHRRGAGRVGPAQAGHVHQEDDELAGGSRQADGGGSVELDDRPAAAVTEYWRGTIAPKSVYTLMVARLLKAAREMQKACVHECVSLRPSWYACLYCCTWAYPIRDQAQRDAEYERLGRSGARPRHSVCRQRASPGLHLGACVRAARPPGADTPPPPITAPRSRPPASRPRPGPSTRPRAALPDPTPLPIPAWPPRHPKAPRRRLQPEGAKSDSVLLCHGTSCRCNLNSYVNVLRAPHPLFEHLGAGLERSV